MTSPPIPLSWLFSASAANNQLQMPDIQSGSQCWEAPRNMRFQSLKAGICWECDILFSFTNG